LALLTEIRILRRGSRRRTLVLDGEPWRDAPSDVVSEAHLNAGDRVDPEELIELLSGIEPGCARDRAVRLLTYRDRSVAELRERLAEDGYLPETVSAVVERLTDVGLVDDERFARSFARTLTQTRHLGRSRAVRELAARGIDPELAAEALDEALSVEAEEVAAGELSRSLARRPGATRDKIAARLARRGYSPCVALSAAREAMSESASGAEPWDGPEPADVAGFGDGQ
jgi:regulatory protein